MCGRIVRSFRHRPQFDSRFLNWEPGVSVLPCEFIPPDQFLADLLRFWSATPTTRETQPVDPPFWLWEKKPLLAATGSRVYYDQPRCRCWIGSNLRLGRAGACSGLATVHWKLLSRRAVPVSGDCARDPIDVVVEAEGLARMDERISASAAREIRRGA